MIRPKLNIPDDETMIRGDACLTLGIPWMVPDAIKWLNNMLNEGDAVLEFGSGGSTVFFSQRCSEVLSIETSEEWFKEVVIHCKRKELRNVNFHLEPKQDRLGPNGKEWGFLYNVLSVDTQGGYNRSAILSAAVAVASSSVLNMVILDNYAHPELFPEDHQLLFLDWEVLDFVHPRWAGNGTRIYVRPDRLKIGA